MEASAALDCINYMLIKRDLKTIFLNILIILLFKNIK